jgi:hypothetical protein
MTEKQKEKIKIQIEKVKRSLTAEKKKFGGLDDSRGLRYHLTALYIKIGDFSGGQRYVKWFKKNLPNDIGAPNFLFESAIISFKTGLLEQAEEYALKTYFSNRLLIDKYFNNEAAQEKNTDESRLRNFHYRYDDDYLVDFSNWLHNFMKTDKYIRTTNEFDELERQLEIEPVGPRRSMLVEKLFKLM